MAKMNLRYYYELAEAPNGRPLLVGKEPASSSEDVTYTTTQALSNQIPDTARFVRIVTDTDALLEFGSSPSVGAGALLLRAGSAEYFGITAGHQIAVKEAV